MVQGRSLLWCAHRFALFENALKALCATIWVDEWRRKRILQKTTPAGGWAAPRRRLSSGGVGPDVAGTSSATSTTSRASNGTITRRWVLFVGADRSSGQAMWWMTSVRTGRRGIAVAGL
jgi:hypothetical protein